MTLNEDLGFNASQFYHASCMKLAKSMVLKSTATAIAMNNEVNAKFAAYDTSYLVDTLHPETWRYYCHLQGKYHYTDELMQVRSLDTLQTIDFTPENLKLHRATWIHYKDKGEYYYELIAKYPDQHLLVDGICNPIDFETAYKAEEYSILDYDRSLVEEQEVDLIPKLNRQIIETCNRFHSRGYGAFDPTFNALKLGILAVHLPGMIIALREQYIKTEQVHSFHIWNYLGSYFGLDKYKRFLTHEQAMWLYKHLPYIDRHAGKEDTFLDIIKWMLTTRSIPIYGYHIGRDTNQILDHVDTPDVYREQLNLKHIDYKSDEDHLSLAKLIDKEVKEANRNDTFRNPDLKLSENRYDRTKHSNQKSKVLESEVFDYANQQVKPMSVMLTNYWAHLAFTNRYSLVGSITNPQTGEPISMDARDAFITWLYCAMKIADDRDLDDDNKGKWPNRARVENMLIPTFTPKDITWDSVDWQDLKSNFLDRKADINLAFNDLQENYPKKGHYYSAEGFHTYVKEVNDYFKRIRHWLGVYHDLFHAGEIQQLGDRLFYQEKTRLVSTEMTFGQYFKMKHWEIDELSRENIVTMANQIYSTFTGQAIDDEASLSEIQQAMIGIMRQLSSYSVQFTHKANATNGRILDMPWLRFGKIMTMSKSIHHHYRNWLIKFNEFNGKGKDSIYTGVLYGPESFKVHDKGFDVLTIPPPIRFGVDGYNRVYHRGTLGILTIRKIRKPVQYTEPYFYYIHNGTLFRWYREEDMAGVEAELAEGKSGIKPDPRVAYRVVDRNTYPAFDGLDDGEYSDYYRLDTPDNTTRVIGPGETVTD